MRNASYLLAATVVATIIAGCGGSSVSSGLTTSTTGNSSAVSTPGGSLTNLQNLGYLETSYLTGAGRSVSRDYGDVVANISLGDFVDNQGNVVSATTGSEVSLQVDAYGGPQVIRTPVTFGVSTTPGVPNTNPNSRLFNNYVFTFDTLSTNLLPGAVILPSQTFVVTGGNMASDELSATALSSTTFIPQSFPAYIRAFPGRFSSLTIRIDPNTIGLNFQTYTDANGVMWGPTNPRGIFEADQFSSINFVDPTKPLFSSVLSDYLSFDISHLIATSTNPNPLPAQTVNGISVSGERVFFSGDTYAIGDNTSSGNFFQLTKDVTGTSFLPGTFNTNVSLNGYTLPSGVTQFLPGTYALNQIDPSDPTFLRKILSLEGMFVDWTKMIKSPSAIQAITFPSSNDNNVQDMVLFKTNSNGQIIDFYYGYVDFQALNIYLFPISTLVSATASSAQTIQGTISTSTLYSASGAQTTNQTAVRYGSFRLTQGLNGSSVFRFADGTAFSGGTFIVYRR